MELGGSVVEEGGKASASEEFSSLCVCVCVCVCVYIHGRV